MFRTTKNIISLIIVCMASLSVDAQRCTLSSHVRNTMLKHGEAMAKGINNVRNHQMMMALVKADDTAALEENGCKVVDRIGDIYITAIPLGSIRTLAADSRVQRIEANRPGKTTNHVARSVVHVPEVWGGELPRADVGYDGTGVVMGVMDIGIDVTHPTFRAEDMQTLRIKALWDQVDMREGGMPVIEIDGVNIGKQYIGEEALLEVQHSYDALTQQHGTHTVGTATGRGVGEDTRYMGMAPNADICLVANLTSNNIGYVPEEMQDLYTTAVDVLGFKYIFDYAEYVGKPCVISFSEGYYASLYEEDILMNEAINNMLGEGKILCASAGNESMRNTYLAKPRGMDKAGAFVAPSGKYADYLICSSDKAQILFTFYSTVDGKTEKYEYVVKPEVVNASEDNTVKETITVNGLEHSINIYSAASTRTEGEWFTDIYIEVPEGNIVGREVPVSITLQGAEHEMSAYSYGGYFTKNVLDASLCQMERSHNILIPGAAERVVCVGSVNAREGFTNINDIWEKNGFGEVGYYSTFSSVGPSIYGVAKPDVCAPGAPLISALNSFCIGNPDWHEGGWDTEHFTWNGRKYGWHADMGTSMACPVVGGIVALWLQACPTLTPEQVKKVLAKTCVKTPDFDTYPAVEDELGTKNYYHGYGMIDAKAGLDYILSHFATGIQNVECDENKTANNIVYDAIGRRVSVMSHGHLYIKNGRAYIYK